MELFFIWNVFWLCFKDCDVDFVSVLGIIFMSFIYILLGGVD